MSTHAASTIEWRMFVGPRWTAPGDATSFDWTLYNEGGTNDLTWGTTIAATLNAGVTTLSLVDGLQFTTSGGVWIGPNGSGQAWEYCPYTGKSGANTLTGLVRENATDREHNGVHTSGAAAKQFIELNTNDGRLRLRESADGNDSTSSWIAEISGVLVPHMALRNHHLIIVQTRVGRTGNFVNTLVGWLNSPRVSDDGDRARVWSARVWSYAQMAKLTTVPGVRIGDLDVMPFAQITGSIPLNKAYKEWHTADVVNTLDTYEHANVADGVDRTVYISEQYVGAQQYAGPETSADPGRNGTAASFDPEYKGVVISQIYLSRPLGEDSRGYRWIEVIAQSEDVTDLDILTEQTTTGVYDIVNLDPSNETYKEGDKIILCEDLAIFMQEWPLTTGRVFELTNPIFDYLKPGGDSIAILTSTTVSPSGDRRWCHGVTWGTGLGVVDPGDPWESDGDPPGEDYPGDWEWQGLTNVPVPGPGEVMRYKFSGASSDSAQYWELTRDATPGYVVGDYTDEDDEDYNGNGEGTGNNNFGQLSPVYLLATLPPTGIKLSEDITNSTPGVGQRLNIVGADGQRAIGIVAPLTIQISDEQITLSSLGDTYGIVSARGANGTTPQVHYADDEVRVLDVYEGVNVATVSHKIKSFGWERPTGFSHPVDFAMYYSGRENPRHPTDEQFTRDWVLAESVTGHASNTYTYTFSTSKRVRHLLLVITKMSNAYERVRISKMFANVDPAFYPSDTWITDALDAGEVIEHILSLAGDVDVDENTTTSEPTDLVTGQETAWEVAADLADFFGVSLIVNRDSKIALADNTLWTASGFTPTHTWTRDNAISADLVWQAPSKYPNQLKLTWRTPDDDTLCTEYYPADEDASGVGVTIEVGPLIYPNATIAGAAARRMFYASKYPYEIVIECAIAATDVRPLQVHRLVWDFNDAMQEVDRYFVVSSVVHDITDGVWTTSINGKQFMREIDG